ncbi:MAG: hypothetical protein WA958_11730 [Tunicatimonas sp.]
MRTHPKLLLLSALCLSLSACGQSTVAPSASTDSSAAFGAAIDRGKLGGTEITEASGLVASRQNPGALWTHNDSGGDPKVYLIDDRGATQSALLLLGARNRDWEDIAVGPGPEDEETYLYVGDIGDNNARHNVKTVYRFIEPVVSKTGLDTVRKIDVLRFVYPDGPRDAETLLVDPLTKDLYVLSKRDRFVHVYRAAFPQNTETIDTLELLGQLPRPQVGILEQLVGGDISPDGMEVLLKSYVQMFYWQRGDNSQTLFELLQTNPQVLPYQPEPQGEAVSFAADGSGYYTLSEEQSNIEPRLYFYPRSR